MVTSRSHDDANEANWHPERKAFALRVGKVVRANPDDHTVDVVLDGGGMIFKALLLETWAGTDHGDLWTPQFTPDPGVDDTGLPAEAWQQAPQGQRDVYCLIGFAAGRLRNPFVLGFFYPEISQMMVPGMQRLTRHVGDSFSGVGQGGDIWLAFDGAGASVGFHDVGNARPPDLTQADYDRRLFTTKRSRKSFTARLANGTSFSLDGDGGTVRLSSVAHIESDATANNDIYGGPVVVRGARDLYLSADGALAAGQCLAPFSEDATVLALNFVVNAAYDRTLTQREGAAIPDIVAARSTGWRFLGDGDAGRLEFGPDGRQRFFSAVAGLRDGVIAWVRPEPDYINHFAHFHFASPGTSAFVCPPERFTITGVEVAGTEDYTLYGAASHIPTADNPIFLTRGQVLRIDVSTLINDDDGAQITLWGNRG